MKVATSFLLAVALLARPAPGQDSQQSAPRTNQHALTQAEPVTFGGGLDDGTIAIVANLFDELTFRATWCHDDGNGPVRQEVTVAVTLGGDIGAALDAFSEAVERAKTMFPPNCTQESIQPQGQNLSVSWQTNGPGPAGAEPITITVSFTILERNRWVHPGVEFWASGVAQARIYFTPASQLRIRYGAWDRHILTKRRGRHTLINGGMGVRSKGKTRTFAVNGYHGGRYEGGPSTVSSHLGGKTRTW